MEGPAAAVTDTPADDLKPSFRSDVTVELVKHTASDADVLFAARVSTAGEQSLDELQKDPERSKGLINYLMRDRHGSPFEHNSMTFFISAPIFVFREFMRHRVGWSYNEESGRYRELEPVFYVPGRVPQAGPAGPPRQVRLRRGQPRPSSELVAPRPWRTPTARRTRRTGRCSPPAWPARSPARSSRSASSPRCTPPATHAR